MATDPSQMSAQDAAQQMHDNLSPDQLKPLLQEHYANMSPDDLKAAIAALQGQLAQQSKPETQAVVAKVDANNPTPEQAVELHAHAQEHHPEVVRNVILAGAGTAAVAGLAALYIRHRAQGNA